MHVVLNTSSYPFYKKYRIDLLLCIFETYVVNFERILSIDLDCVAAVERLPALHYSVDFVFLSFGIMGFVEEL